MISKILIEALDYFYKLVNIAFFLIVAMLIFTIAYINGKKIGQKMAEIYKRFKR